MVVQLLKMSMTKRRNNFWDCEDNMKKQNWLDDFEREQNCKDCKWRNKRHQKCTCCARNISLKDNYEKEDNDGRADDKA